MRLIRIGWGRDNAAFRNVFTNQFLPGGTPAQHAWWNELERLSASPENAARLLEALHEIDVTALARAAARADAGAARARRRPRAVRRRAASSRR